MPNIITHSLFAKEMADRFPDAGWLHAREHLFTVGSNGPDYLFFYGFGAGGPLKGATLRRYGGQLHKGHVNAFYESALRSIRHEKDPAIRQDMIAYVCGHLSHWALDSTVHPYVYYRTGHGSAQNSWNHHRMESVLDSIVLKVKNGETTKQFDTPAIANCSLEEARAVARIYVPAIEAVFNEQIAPHQIKDALDDWHRVQKLEHDPKGVKLASLKSLEKLTGTKNLASGLIVPNAPVDDYDICNLTHKKWIHPADENRVSTESFFDLYDKALITGETAIRLFLAAVDDKAEEKDFLRFIGNRTYNEGLPEDLPMVHFDVCDFTDAGKTKPKKSA